MSVLLERAKAIVEREFAKKYEEGECYKLHTYRVMEAMDTEEEQIVALLHDIIEDTEVSMADLEGEGFSKTILGAVEDLTKGNSIRYFDYIEDLSLNPLAAKVKLADLRHNSDLTRLACVDDAARERAKKYAKAIEMLTK